MITTLTFLQSSYGVHCSPDHFATLHSSLGEESAAPASPVLAVAQALGAAVAVAVAGVVVAAVVVADSYSELDAAGHIEYVA